MPRRKVTADDALTDQALPGLDELDQDPAPRAARTRRAPARTAGNRGRIPARTTGGRILSKAAMQTKVREEMIMYLSLAAAGWSMRDPECASEVTDERIVVIADRLVAMISRSDDLLKTAARSGIIGEIFALLHALYPIGKAVWRAHGPSGRGHAREEMDPSDLNDRFPAFAG